MVSLVSRAQWEARSPTSSLSRLTGTKGVIVHYEGTITSAGPHKTTCANRVAAIQRYHLNHPIQNYIDIAYNFVVCDHGSIFEGRGFGVRSGANGSAEANRLYHAVCWLGGPTMTPSLDARQSLRWIIDEHRRRDRAGELIRPHLAVRSTSCPGDDLREWIRQGAKVDLTPQVRPVTGEEKEMGIAIVDKDLPLGFKGTSLANGVMIGCVQGGNSGVDATWLSLGCDGDPTGFRVAYRTAEGVTVQHYVVSPTQGRYSLGMVSPAVTDLVVHRVPVDPVQMDELDPSDRSGENTPAHVIVEYRS